jgi:HK97 family phage portal protein
MRFLPFKKKSKRFSELLPSWKTGQDAKFNTWSTEKAIAEGMKASTYVYSCVQLIARSVASVPWYCYKQDSKGDWTVIENHPLQLLVDKPTPFHSRKDLMVGMVQHLYLGGNAVFTKVRGGNVVAELWQLPPDAIKVIPSRKEFIDRYEYSLDGVTQNFAPRDILHNKFNDPSNPYWGLSPLQAGAKAVDSDIEAVRFQKLSLQNRAITDGVFTFEHPLTKDQWDEARAMVREQHQGMNNAHTPWILGAGAKWEQMSLSPMELDFLNSRKFTREEICSIFQVPPPMIGILENSTYNNIETARKIFWVDTIIPLLEDIKDCFNQSLTPEFGTGFELSYDISNVDALQTNIKDKIETAKNLFSMGVPFNMINQKLELGFDDIEGGDMGYLPSGLMPTDILLAPPEPQVLDPNPQVNPNEPNPPPKKSLKRHNLRTETLKERYAQTVHRKRDSWVINLTRKSAKLFEAEGEAVARAVRSGESWEKAINSNKKKWEILLNGTYQNIVAEIGKDHFLNITKGYKPSEEKGWRDFFNPYRADITKYIIELAGTKVTLVSDWTRQVIGALVLEAQDSNDTMDNLAKNIKNTFQEFSRYRAYRIARTETQNALGFAQYSAGKQAEEILGEKLVGEWWTSLDDRVRDSHKDLHGEKAPLGKAFSNGLMYAGEYTQTETTGDNINCRCVILHHFEGEEDL